MSTLFRLNLWKYFATPRSHEQNRQQSNYETIPLSVRREISRAGELACLSRCCSRFSSHDVASTSDAALAAGVALGIQKHALLGCESYRVRIDSRCYDSAADHELSSSRVIRKYAEGRRATRSNVVNSRAIKQGTREVRSRVPK